MIILHMGSPRDIHKQMCMKISRPLRLLACVAVAILALGIICSKHENYYKIRLLRRLIQKKIIGDTDLMAVLDRFHVRFIPEKLIKFPLSKTRDEMRPLWAFRLSHAVPTYPVPLVDDTDKDGVPEVYIGSYSKQLYVLNGITGDKLWEWHLPFGVVGGVSLAIDDLDNDGEKEILVGAHTSHPIRLYALRSAKKLGKRKRLKWVQNFSGDFIEGGVNIVTHEKRKYIIVATRDAPYSRGTINVLNAYGEFIYSPIFGVDICASRPAIGFLGHDRNFCFIHGSHKFYNAIFGNTISARDLLIGKGLWNVNLKGDTGSQNHQIVDADFDGENDVVAYVSYNEQGKLELPKSDGSLVSLNYKTGDRLSIILDGVTGLVKRYFQGKLIGIITKNRSYLVQERDDGPVYCYDEKGRLRYKMRGISFGIYLDDSNLYLVDMFYNKNRVVLELYNAFSGSKIKKIEARLSLPRHNMPSDYGIFGAPQDMLEFKTLADTDNDGYWNALVLIDDFVVNLHLPIRVGRKYNPYVLVPFRNINNAGPIYDPE